MSGSDNLVRDKFLFGREPEDPPEVGTVVSILLGDILQPGVDVDAVVSSDDNYLTMASGVSERLRNHTLADPQAGGDPRYIREAQEDCPVDAGKVVVTDAYGLKEHLGVKHVLHGTVVDYDSEMDDVRKCEIVEQTTVNCLHKAEELGLDSILFPAFATGAGQLSKVDCARFMSRAIKSYLALDRPIQEIYIILYDGDPEEENLDFVKEASCVLAVPYDPRCERPQIRDFYGRDQEINELEEIITGKRDEDGKKRHAIILGGPSIGKGAILDQLYHRAQQPDGPLSQGRRLVRLNFGAVHDKTPKTFVYRKFYHALAEDAKSNDLTDAEGTPLEEKLAELYADLGQATRKGFLQFLQDHKDHYPELVFLINKLPRLLQGEDERPGDETNIRSFWRDLDELQDHVRFVYTARPDSEYQKLQDERLAMAKEFRRQIAVVSIPCVREQDRKEWVDALFRRYLDCTSGAPGWADQFLKREAGRHPYLISLLGYILVRQLKEKTLERSDWSPCDLDPQSQNRVCEQVLWEAEEPQRAFFGRLVNFLRISEGWEKYRSQLEMLTKAVAIEEGRESLMQFFMVGDPNAVTEMLELKKQGDPRLLLDVDWLRRLEDLGYLIDTETEYSARFMSDSFAAYVSATLVGHVGPWDQPADVTISILAPRRDWMRTVFRGRGAKVIAADQPFRRSDRDLFMESFRDFVNLRFRQLGQPVPEASPFADTEQIGKHILTQFATLAIRRYLWKAPRRSTVLFIIDEDLAEVPWELMLEATYAGEIPFRVGRTIISRQPPQSVLPPVRGIGKVRALLIGNPSGDPKIRAAEEEVKWLATTLTDDEHAEFFEKPKVLIGPQECQSIRLLSELSSGRFGLVHYAGHAHFRGSDSAWQVGDGPLTAHQLTKAIQSAPPVMVFCSACRSAEAGAARDQRYEGQSFDLPGAFLQAGVEAYLGALWPVDASRSTEFTKAFYTEFLKRTHELGECLRLAKWARKQQEESILLVPTAEIEKAKNEPEKKLPTPIDWLAFVLYGDPCLAPGDLFPAMANLEQ